MFEDPADLQAVCTGRRRTCALLNSPLPCVNKAVSHIQELKMIVEDWCQQVNWSAVWESVKDCAATRRWKYKSTENVFLFCRVPVWKVSAADGSGQAPVPQNFKVKSALLWFWILLIFSVTLIYRPFNRFQSRDSDAESVMSTELFVEGIAINSRGENRTPFKIFFFPPSNAHARRRATRRDGVCWIEFEEALDVVYSML